MAKVASPRARGAARRRGADAAVGELPREGLLVADDPRRGRDPELGARPVRAAAAPASATSRTWLVFSYLWLPYMILPIYAGLERIPDSLLDASGDLGGRAVARRSAASSCRSRCPAIVAGSIFTFSLTLGDYITPQLVSSTQFIGNVVYANVGIANNLPLAAAFATVPVVDHDRLPPDRAAARRVRGALMHRLARHALAAADRHRRSRSRSSTCRWSSSRIYAFNETAHRRRGRPPGFTLDWFDEGVRQPGRARRAVDVASRSALGATAIALVLGTLAAFAVARYRFFGRDDDLVPRHPADRAAGHRHRHGAERDVHAGARRRPRRCSR